MLNAWGRSRFLVTIVHMVQVALPTSPVYSQLAAVAATAVAATATTAVTERWDPEQHPLKVLAVRR